MKPGYEAVIGLEVHVQLRTRSKMFCACRNLTGAPPNSLTCPVCLGLPGALPALNAEAVRMALALGLAVEAEIRPRSAFYRKQYFYPDLPKGMPRSPRDPWPWWRLATWTSPAMPGCGERKVPCGSGSNGPTWRRMRGRATMIWKGVPATWI